ncbi:hypothetical protein FPQ18DRAFT_364368 [Pyronema domesticum]|nr:hypothetical protein FPQ18DRAFT_364368 [Pyronema domesticum]
MTYPPNLIPSSVPAAANTYPGSRPQNQCLEMQTLSTITTPLSSTNCQSESCAASTVSGLGISTPLCTPTTENLATSIPRIIVPKITPETHLPARKSKIEKAKHLITQNHTQCINPPPQFVGGGYSGIPSHHVNHNTSSPQCFSPTLSSTWPVNNSARNSRTHLNAPNQPMLRRRRSGTMPARLNHPADTLSPEKPQASSTNGSVSMTIRLHSPILFQQGLEAMGRENDEHRESPTKKKTEFFEEKSVMHHTWPFFNAKFPTVEAGHLADSYIPRDASGLSGGRQDWLSNPEIEDSKPETINTEYGTVRYHLEGSVERVNSFGIKSTLYGSEKFKYLPIRRHHAYGDETYPRYKNVEIHRVKASITEAIEYVAMDGKVHRIIEPKKIPLSTNVPINLWKPTYKGTACVFSQGGGFDNRDFQDGAVSILHRTKFDIGLPGCDNKGKNRIHHNTTYKNILVNHWIKIVIRISKADAENPEKRRFFEITIDSPFHVLSCHVTNPNTQLPMYGTPSAENIDRRAICNCAANRATRPTAPMDRPMHLIRAPSNLPPDYDEDSSPPPCMTPPPNYEGLFQGMNGQGMGCGMDDYFSRREIELGEEPEMQLRRGMMIPLTPGRAGPSRSFDEPRRRWLEELDGRP